MKVAMLAPISHPVPPAGYGPWERVAADLTEGLVAEGVDVTLFAAAGATTSARLVATSPHPLEHWPDEEGAPDHRLWEELHIATMAQYAHQGHFDLVHSHLHVHALGYAPLLPVPMVSTLHGVAWNRATHPALLRHRDQPYVSISDSERRFLPELRYVATVYNGVDPSRFTLGDGSGGFLLFAGRMAPEKAPHLAVEIARQAGVGLRLAGAIEDRHGDYFDSQVRPALTDGAVEYLGPVDQVELAGLYRQALALLMPLMWEEPFGLVAAEALVSGTPVVAWRRGALPELVEEGVSGALVDEVPGAVAAVQRVGSLDRAECRRRAVERFGVEAMTRGYLRVYRELVSA